MTASIAELTDLLGEVTAPGYDQVRRSRELPTPLRLGLETLRSELAFEVTFWAAEVGLAADVSPRMARCRLPVRVARASAFLVHRVDLLLRLDPTPRGAWYQGEPVRDVETGEWLPEYLTGLDGALRLVELQRRVRRAVGRTALVHRLTPACPWCDQTTLIRKNGSSSVECESCDKIIPEKHYDWLVAVIVREQRRVAS